MLSSAKYTIGLFVWLFLAQTGFAQINANQQRHMRVVIDNPHLADLPEMFPSIEGILNTFADNVRQLNSEELEMEKRLYLLKQYSLVANYANALVQTKSKQVMASIFRMCNSKDKDTAEAGRQFIKKMVWRGNYTNPLLFSQFKRQVLERERGPLEIPNCVFALEEGLSKVEGEMLDKAIPIIAALIREYYDARPGLVEYQLALTAAESLTNLKSLSAEESRGLLGLFRQPDLDPQISAVLASSMHKLSTTNPDVFGEILELVTDPWIADTIKHPLLLDGFAGTVWDEGIYALKERSGDRKKLKALAPEAAKKMVGLLGSKNPLVRLAAMEHAFALMVVFGVKNNELFSALEQQLLSRNIEVRMRARLLYSAAVEVSPAFHGLLKAPANLGIIEKKSKPSLCAYMFLKALRGHRSLVIDWTFARSRH